MAVDTNLKPELEEYPFFSYTVKLRDKCEGLYEKRIENYRLAINLVITKIICVSNPCLEKQFEKYKKIAEADHGDVLMLIQKGKEFFERWREGTIPLEDYLEIYVDKNTPEYEFLRDLIVQQQEFVNSKEEAELVNGGISHIMQHLESNRL